jgi:hypothetical protein
VQDLINSVIYQFACGASSRTTVLDGQCSGGWIDGAILASAEAVVGAGLYHHPEAGPPFKSFTSFGGSVGVIAR